MAGLVELTQGNSRFLSKVDRRKLAELAGGQKPRTIVLACSDSRVSPEITLDAGLGELFVVRSAGNVADDVAIGSIEYAAEHLGSSLLLVVGHSSCGAVKAAVAGGHATECITAIVKKIIPAVEAAKKGGAAGDALVAKSVENNVRNQIAHIFSRSPLLSQMRAEGKLSVVGAVYELASGRLHTLQ